MHTTTLRIHLSVLRIVPVLFLMIVCSPLALSQSDQVSVEVELSRSSVYVGDDLTYQIIVRGADNPTSPVVSFPDTINAQYHGRTWQSFTSMRVINGRNSTVTEKRFSFQFTLRAIESGIITIPAPTIEVDGQLYTGQASSFESRLPAQSDDDLIEITIQRDDIYLNESVILQCEWWIPGQTSEFSFTSSAIPSSFELLGLEPPQQGMNRIGFEINGQQLVAVTLDDQRDGVRMTKFVFNVSVTPTQAGNFTLGPFRSVFTRQTSNRNAFRAYAESNTIDVRVQPVPTENQPAGYSGAIGEFELRALSSNTTVNVGDPIGVTLRIRGQEPMVGVSDAPDLNSIPAFVDQFKISSEGWREVLPRQSGQRIYETTIRALSEQVSQIPSVELSSFNPATRSYKVYRSQPIKITVNPVQEITLSDAIVTGGAQSTPVMKPTDRVELTRAMPGLWAHGSMDDLQSSKGFSLIETIRNPVQISVLASGPCLFAFSLIFAIKRSRGTPQSATLCRALRQSQRLARSGHFGQALRHYVAIASGINEEALAAQDAYLLPIDDSDAKQLAFALDDVERGAYLEKHSDSQRSRSNNVSPSDAAQLLKRIHKQILCAGRGNS